MSDTNVYLGARKCTPEKIGRHVDEAISGWEILIIRTATGAQLRRAGRVMMRRPRWMPRWFYVRLLGTIVVDYRDALREKTR